MLYKKWIISFFLISSFLIGSVGLVNYSIDPFNIFSHKNFLNSLSVGFNERIQKSVYLKYNSSQNYDAILLGSSRATFYNQKLFKGVNLYNFSFSGSSPIEYNDYLEYAKKNNHKKISTIILGLDFYMCNSIYCHKENFPIIENKIIFFFNNYFSLDTLKYSIINIKRSLLKTTGHRSYDRENIVHSDKVNSKRVELLSTQRSKTYYATFISYNKKYKNILFELKNKNKLSNFIVYTSPLSKDFLTEIYHDKKLVDFYFKWMRDMVSVFDKIYFFTLSSPLSEKYTKYSIDGDHFYPEVGKIISDILMEEKSIGTYGVVLNKQNIEKVIEKIKFEIKY